ncbi:PAS domain-containing protein [uncultured Amaricoccus sp.]|uniref:PAS domain-containing protein n=2 Tax=Amaricoccus TaxID=56999 RepID=UPI0026192B4C|nr:PAS domain-containing protein [uncultured Amaricoccus sp.]
MNDLMLSSLKTYWDRLRAGRVAPYRAEIDPRQFESALENMFIIEKLAPDNMRVRLAGMRICEMMGMEVRGMQPGFMIEEADRQRFDRLLMVVMNEPAVVELRLAARNRAGTYHATMLMMPLRSDFGEINRVIGCTSGESDLFAPPLSFAIEDVAVTPVEATQDAEPRSPMPGFAEAQAAFAPPPPAAPGPKLRSIDGNPNAPARPRDGGRLSRFRVIDGD